MAINTPILLITFNRPSHTRRVLERILEAKPQALYVFQDGAREDNANDAVRCAEVREVVNELTARYAHEHKDFVLHTLYSSTNLGCGQGPMTGISWFFEHVEQGIVMEDDCLAHLDFFPYCEELLNRYKGTEVKFINSTLYDNRWTESLQKDAETISCSYGFSRYMVTGAWASWREVWTGFDLDLRAMDANAFRKQVLMLTDNKAEADWWYYAVLEIQKDYAKKSYWDFQMQIHLFRMGAVTIHPVRNLISNIGFDAEGTHTLGNDGRGDKEVFPIIPLRHPAKIYVDKQRDAYCFAKAHSKGFWRDMLSNLYSYLLWSDGWGHQLLVQYKKIKGSGYNMHRV